jgi:UrcA family protein
MTRILIAALAALASTAASASASTIEIHGDQAYIGYKDLNLSSPEGRQALLGRIKAAAKQVCNPEEFNSFSQADPACVRIAVTGGLEQMDVVMTAPVGS